MRAIAPASLQFSANNFCEFAVPLYCWHMCCGAGSWEGEGRGACEEHVCNTRLAFSICCSHQSGCPGILPCKALVCREDGCSWSADTDPSWVHLPQPCSGLWPRRPYSTPWPLVSPAPSLIVYGASGPWFIPHLFLASTLYPFPPPSSLPPSLSSFLYSFLPLSLPPSLSPCSHHISSPPFPLAQGLPSSC